MKMIYYITLLITTCLMACGGDMPPIDPPEVEIKVFDFQWATRVDMNKEVVGTDNTQQYKDWMLVGGDIGDPPTIKAFNKTTGVMDWEYVHEGSVHDRILISTIYNYAYIGLCSDGIIAIDLETRNVIWEIDYSINQYSIGGRNLQDEEGAIYVDVSKGGVGLNSKSAAILKIDIGTGEFEEAYESVNDLEGLKSINPVAVSEVDGRLVLFFNEEPNAELAPQNVRQQMVAYDLNEKEVLWKSNVTDGFSSNSLHPPIIYQDLVITGGDWSMYAFDIHTGEQRWKTEVSPESQVGNWTKTNHLIHEDRLYVNQTESHIACLNPLTGDFIWDSTDAPNCTDNMLYYEKEDYLVFTSWGNGSVMILDALTGETIHREHRYDDSQYNNDVVYDEALDMFFTSTYKHAIGFKINAPE